MTFHDAFVQIRRENLTWREIDGVIIALDLSSSTYFTTNRTGRFLWHAMIEGATIAELIAELRSSFHISDESAETDVRNFIKLLDGNNLLRRAHYD